MIRFRVGDQSPIIKHTLYIANENWLRSSVVWFKIDGGLFYRMELLPL